MCASGYGTPTADGCSACAANTYSPPDAAACTACPTGTQSPVGSDSLDACVADVTKLNPSVDTIPVDTADSTYVSSPTAANAEVMRRSHVACHAAAIAWILKRKLRFDPGTESFLSADGRPDHEADALRSRPERDCFAV